MKNKIFPLISENSEKKSENFKEKKTQESFKEKIDFKISP